ncbi:alpha/beta hydrolase [Marivita sp. XM-24bin2]|jgi:pimeloyl-ACP methyl ester carboxylesterase|uniref:alpha/beta fold hydrolase n=1 Tax=unclassified Marivita TaxID=2632480 RepID=UPI000D78F2BB|nr:alpha/beta hydrolase [Marivita sp. XM-24bin2]MCR9109038.1 alpha/beta hydrolase [Paracoccaceae bacterium]PWL36973.1 MAG: alpha/beta hydrolase [Marivita sp. XM-24bin2]
MLDNVRGGFPVYTRSFGHGLQSGLLLHCALAHSKVWAPLATHLSDELTMIAPDMPGHGRSAAWDQRSDLHDQVTAIALDCLRDGGHVIGHSFGATVALRLAIEAPERVHSLTLIEPVLFAAARESDETVFQNYLDTSRGFGAALDQEDWAKAAADFIRVWGDGRPWGDLSEKEQTLFSAQMPFIRETEPCLVDDANDLLSGGRPESIQCPTQLIRGAESEPVIAAIHATLARRIPQASDAVVAGAGHMVPITHPEQVAALVKPLIIG